MKERTEPLTGAENENLCSNTTRVYTLANVCCLLSLYTTRPNHISHFHGSKMMRKSKIITDLF